MNRKESELKKHADNFRDYQRAIEPIVKAKTDFYMISMPTITIHKDGTVEQKYNFTAEQEESLRLIDENIKYIAKQFGFNSQE